MAALCILALTASGCVTSKRYKELEARKNAADFLNDSLSKRNRELEGLLADTKVNLSSEQAINQQLRKDTTDLGLQYRDINTRYLALVKENRELEDKYVKLARGSESEASRLLKDLRTSQDQLLEKEAELLKLEAELKEKAKKLEELERILAQKDQDVQNLKNKVLEALKGFKDNGLTVEIRNGKVYVSMDEKLLFASGSAEVDKKGQEALQQLARVLEKDPEIFVMIEGHTDNVPLRGTGCNKDNWDLSVQRANSIIRILLKNSTINPGRLTAAGRSEFAPLVNNDTPENRAKNRRTEIILTPKLNELFKILETN